MFYTLGHSFKAVDPSNLKFLYESLKDLVLGHIENCELSSKGVTLAAWRLFIFRHEAQNCYNSKKSCSVSPKL